MCPCTGASLCVWCAQRERIALGTVSDMSSMTSGTNRTPAQQIQDANHDKTTGRFQSLPHHESGQSLGVPSAPAPAEYAGVNHVGEHFLEAGGYKGNSVRGIDAHYMIDFDQADDPEKVSSRFEYSNLEGCTIDAADLHQVDIKDGVITDLRSVSGGRIFGTIIEDRIGSLENADLGACIFQEGVENYDLGIHQTGPWYRSSLTHCDVDGLTLNYPIEMGDTNVISGGFRNTRGRQAIIRGGSLRGDWSGSQFQGATLDCDVSGIYPADFEHERIVYDDSTTFQAGFDPKDHAGTWVHVNDVTLDY